MLDLFQKGIVQSTGDRPIVLFSSLLLFLILFSGFMAEFSHWPKDQIYFDPLPNTSFLRQYDGDAHNFFMSSYQFPEMFREYPTRTERPVMPLIANLFGETIYMFVRPFKSGIEISQACIAVGFLVFKLLFHGMGLVACFHLFSCYLNRHTALMATMAVFLVPMNILAFAHFHTYEQQIITPILMTFALVHIIHTEKVQKPTYHLVVIYSLVVGVLMLMKSNYAVYLAIAAFALLMRHPIILMASIALHFVPYIVYNIYLYILDIPWKSAQAGYGQGTWLISAIHTENFGLIWERGLEGLILFFSGITSSYGFWLIPGTIGLYFLWKGRYRSEALFIILLIGSTFIQAFAAKRFAHYMMLDFWFLIVGLSYFSLYHFLLEQNLHKKAIDVIFSIVTASWAFYAVSTFLV